MRVLILGFDNVNEIDKIMNTLIESAQCFLFSVLCSNINSLAANWARWRGAPIIFIQPKNLDDLVRETDFLLIKLTDEAPAWERNLVMRLKAEGKHGHVVKG